MLVRVSTRRPARQQSKPVLGRCPHTVDVAGGAREFHPIMAGVYYWPDGADLAVFYDTLGQAVVTIQRAG